MNKLLFSIFLLGASKLVYAQCGSNVPTYTVDLTGAPDSTWVLLEQDALDRQGQCCGVSSSKNCISFEIIPDPNCGGIYFDYDGAGAFGSLKWQIDCGPEYNLKDTICLANSNPFTLTFCKPGTDNGNYTLVSVSKPTFPADQVLPLNCVESIEVLGVTATSVSWLSVEPNPDGAYNSYLSCDDCIQPTFTPDPAGPNYIEYQVCGYPILDYCPNIGALMYCDTMSFTILDSLQVFADNESFCSGSAAIVTPVASGGDGNYTFYYYNSSMSLLGSGPNFTFSTAGVYTVEVRDGNYEPGNCAGFFHTFTVSEVYPPVSDAGDDQVLCATYPNANLTGLIANSPTGIWTGGTGTYVSSNTDLSLTYIPTTTEINFGSVTLTLTSTGAGTGCTEDSDEVTLFFIDTIETNLTDMVLDCSNSEIAVMPTITGGLPLFEFQWTNGDVTQGTTLGTGTHCLTITDANGCQASDCITITAPAALNLTVNSTPVTTDGGSDGTATAIPSGGTSPYSYSWNTGGTTAGLTGLPYGLYTVTVTDDNGCQLTGSTVVNKPFCAGFSVNTAATSALCFDDSSGTATVTTVNGTSPFNILWNDYASQITSTANNLPAGTYTVVVTDDNGCLATGVVAVNEPTALSNTFTHTDVTTQGGSDGSAQTNVSGGTGTYDYLWSNLATTDDISGVAYGWYSVGITDDNGCVLEDSLYISQPPCNLFDIYVGTSSVLCNGDANGSAVLTISNGSAPYNITWSTGQTGVTNINGLAAAVYTVEVTDQQNCYAFASFGVAEPSPLTLGLLTTPATCFGADDGTINLTVSGGTFPFYDFLWNSGVTTEDRINLSPGTYSVTVTDNNGCIANSSTLMTEPDSIELAYSVTHVTCFEGNDGAIDLTVLGGSPVFTYSWSNGDGTQDLSGLDVGGYILQLTDGNFCSLPEPLTILVNQPEKVEADTIIIHCPVPGSSVAQVDVTPTGGTADYSLSFDNGATMYTVGDYTNDLPVDASYMLIIEDANGCLSDMYPFSIDTNVIAEDINFNLCYYGTQSTEMVTVVPAGGTADYSISTDNAVNFGSVLDYDFNLNINSSYLIVVQDSKGCVSETYPISLPDILDLSVFVTSDYNGSDISCFGLSDGSVGSTVSGGTSPYNYSWSNSATSASVSGLSAGTYTLTLTDDNGCVITDNATLVNPPMLVAPVSITSDYNGEDISCHGLGDGEATVSATGGTGAYTYNWTNGQTSAVATGLSAGNYSVTVYDANLCSASNSVFLTEPDTINITAVITDVSCNGGNDGAIDITPTGGVMPYGYMWSNSATTEDINTLPAGTYQVGLTDANGCVYVLNNLVVDPTAIDLDIVLNPALCHGDSTGAADLSAIGGTPPYTYLWTTSETTQDIANLPAGFYSVVVTDDNGCWTTIGGTVSEPDTLSISEMITDALCYGDANGSILISAGGGVQPYNYLWSNADSDSLAENLLTGSYTVTVTDANACEFVAVYSVGQPDSLYATSYAPLNFHNHHITFYNGSDGSIDVEVTGGTSPYLYDWSNGSATQDISSLPAGYYELIITDANGCQYTLGDSLTQPYDLEMPTAMSPNGDNKNDYFVVHGLEAYPDNYFVVTNRWGNVVYEKENYSNDWGGLTMDGKELPDGVYYVILTINDGEIELTGYVELRRK